MSLRRRLIFILGLAAATAGAVGRGMLVPALGAPFIIHIGHKNGSISGWFI